MRAARGGAGRVSGGSVCLFVLAVNHSLVDHCSLANPVERPEALRILLSVGVESAADMCHLEQDDLQLRSLRPPPKPAMFDSELSSAVPCRHLPRGGAAAYPWEEAA